MIEIINILLWVAVAVWALLFVQMLLNRLMVPDLSRMAQSGGAADGSTTSESTERPLVSIVVPARNEERGIRQAVISFCTQDYPNIEVTVVDDCSTDATPDILAELSAQYPQLKVVPGREPPPGWMGKMNALEVGKSHATGDWLLFADADSHFAPSLVRKALDLAIHESAGMLTVRPSHISKGFFEGVLMSGVNFFFFVVSPAFLISRTRNPMFHTGSPVCNLIRRDALVDSGAFESLKDAVIDDVTVGMRVKEAGHKLSVAYAGSLIPHRMYGGARETIAGFGKTTYPTIKDTPWMLPLYLLLGTTTAVLPYLALACGLMQGIVNTPATIALILTHAVFAGLVIFYREPWYTLFTSPLREIGWMWIFVRSFILYHRKGLVWRGRAYADQKSSPRV